jgi:hypothetical protein
MKTKFKKVIPVLILLIALIFNSCETQEEIVRNDNKNVNVENKSFKELENNSLFNRAYSKFNITKLARTTSRTGIEDTYNFTIDPSLIKVITSDEKVSYNFLVRRDSIDTGKYENLVLEVKNSEEVSAYIFKYLEYNDEVSYKNGLPEIMLLNLEGENLENRIIQFCYKIPVAVSCNQAGTCGETTYVYGPHPIGPCCSNSSFYNYETQTQCNTYDIVGFDNFSGGGGSGGGGNPFSGDVFILTNPQNFNGVGTPQNGATSLNVNVISVSENDITNNNIHNNDSPYNSFYNGLTQEQKDWLDDSLSIKINISQYIQQNTTNNVINPESLNFANWAVGYLFTNQTVTWEVFKKRFLTPLEGIEDLGSGDLDSLNLNFPQQNLPSFDDFILAFPSRLDPNFETSQQIYTAVGGSVLSKYNQGARNTCALRVSRGLNYSGITIPNIPGITVKGADNKNYFLVAKNLLSWMKSTFGTPTGNNHLIGSQGGENGENFPNLLNGKQGIYIMIPNDSSASGFDASGHADLFFSDCDGGCYYAASGGVSEIFIWILP